MEDPKLNRSIEETRELATRWSQFHDFFRMGVKGENITPQAEMKFLEVKMRVALLHGSFMASVRHDQKIAQNIIAIMSTCILLKRLKGMNASELQKLEYDWNESYLLISETLSQLEDEREALLPVSERLHKLNDFRRNALSRSLKLARNPFFIVGLLLLLLLGSLIGAPLLGYYDITRLKSQAPFTRKFYDPVMNTLRVVFPEIPYSDFAEVKQKDPAFGKKDPSARGSLINGVGEAAILELTNRGFPREQVLAFFDMFQGNRAFASSVFLTPNDTPMLEHYILFKTTEDARRVQDLRRDHMNNVLNQEARYNIDANLTICRRANLLVLLELGSAEYRREFAMEKWGFKESEIGV